MISIIKDKHLGGFNLVGPEPGTCPECGVEHPPEQPHNQQSLFYQYKFYNDNGRWPTWADAMAHCSEDIKAFWKKELAARGAWIEQ
jgi:hypothetical protein